MNSLHMPLQMPYCISDFILDSFRGKTIRDIVGDRGYVDEIENNLGTFLRITNGFGSTTNVLPITKQELLFFEKFINRNLSLINGVSKNKEIQFRKRNLNKIEDFIGLSLKKYDNAHELINLIKCRNISQLKQRRSIKDEDILYCSEPNKLLFLDIETTGQSNSEIFLIGLCYFQYNEKLNNDEIISELLFAREIVEEAALLKYFIDLLPRFNTIITYNGKTFDIPFIIDRIGTLLEMDDIKDCYNSFKSPLYNEKTEINNKSEINSKTHISSSYDMIKSIFNNLIHLDLYFAVRKTYKDLFTNFKLTTVERELIDFHRKEHLPSGDVPSVYLDWVENNDKFAGGIYKVLEHNYFDIINLIKIMKEWISTKIEELSKETAKKIDQNLVCRKVYAKLIDDYFIL